MKVKFSLLITLIWFMIYIYMYYIKVHSGNKLIVQGATYCLHHLKVKIIGSAASSSGLQFYKVLQIVIQSF